MNRLITVEEHYSSTEVNNKSRDIFEKFAHGNAEKLLHLNEAD